MKTTFGLPKKREQVINLLQKAFVEQNLEESDYDNRLKQAMEASSVEELQMIISDFPNAPRLIDAPQIQHAQPLSVPTTSGVSQNLSVLFSNKKTMIAEQIANPMRVSTYLGEQNISLRDASVEGQVLAIKVDCGLGSTNLDLRGQQFAGKQIQLNVSNVMAEIRVLVPKGVQVDNNVNVIMGEVNHSQQKFKKWFKALISGKKEIEGPVIPYRLSLYGQCIMGSVEIVHD